MRWSRVLGVGGSVAAAVVLAGCSDGSGPSTNPIPTTVTPVGSGQTSMVGTAVPTAIGVTVKDQSGSPMSGVAVTFAVSAGGGFLNPATDTTDGQGRATTAWVLGNTAGSNNNGATATVSGYSGAPAAFTASATPIVSAYNIDLRFLTPMSPTQTAAFTSAAARWSSIVVGDLPSVSVVVPADSCVGNIPAMNETVDDIVIFASIDSIDGPGNVLGGASPCYLRSTSGLTVVGNMVFDSADVAVLEANNILDAVILHEMGHVLGIGTLWTAVSPSLLTGGGTADPYFTGAGGIFQFNRDGGATYVGNKVPVENTGGTGTADGHWREAVMGRELMTGWISFVANPLSTISVASLADLGYTVSYANADAYTVSPVNLRIGGAEEGMELVELQPRVPMKRVDAAGRILRGK
jgi:hypothetical protein